MSKHNPRKAARRAANAARHRRDQIRKEAFRYKRGRRNVGGNVGPAPSPDQGQQP
jgi:hypothetical protein